MVTLTARINISENGGTISSVSGNDAFVGTNVSSELSTLLGNRNLKIDNPFILGSSKLGSGAKYIKNIPFFMSRQLSDGDGNFANPYTITISGENIEHAILVFDKENNGHPTLIEVDGVSCFDDDAQFELVFDSSGNTHTVTISNWNKPHSSLIITSIYADINIDIDKSNLISFDGLLAAEQTMDYPNYGLISNRQNLAFMDYDGQVLDLIRQKILNNGTSVSIKLNNFYPDFPNEQVDIARVNIKELNYDNDNRQVNLTLGDNLEKLQEIQCAGFPYDFNSNGATTASTYYNYLVGKTLDEGFDIYPLKQLSTIERANLNAVWIPRPFLEDDTLWNQWQKLCEIMLAQMYVDEVGKIRFKCLR